MGNGIGFGKHVNERFENDESLKAKRYFLKNPFHKDIKVLYPAEYKVAESSRPLVQAIVGCPLYEDEVGYIALHIRAGRMDEKLEESLQMVSLMKLVTKMVEDALNLSLNPESFMFERFMAHLRYLIIRIRDMEPVTLDMDEYARTNFPDTYRLAQEICDEIGKEMQRSVPREAIGHLTIHIERLRRP